MPKLVLYYVEEVGDASKVSVPVTEVVCYDLLSGLVVLHEKLNAVGMPKVYNSTTSLGSQSTGTGWQGKSDDHRVTISC